MTKENPYNPAEPGFWISCHLDGLLTDADQARLHRALQVSKDLQSESEAFRAVNRLVKRWGEDQVELDWHTFAATVQERIECGDIEPELTVVDHWLARWGGTVAPVDEKRFVRQVMARAVRREPFAPRSIVRWGLPLAAAAAVVIGVMSSFWTPPVLRPASMVAIGPVYVSAQSPTAVALVSFRRDVIPEPETSSGEPMISLIAVGSSPVDEWSETPPL